MDAYLQSVAAYFGFPRLVLQLDERSRQRIIRVGALPALVFSAALASVSLEITFGGIGLATIPEFWERIWLVTRVFQSPFLPVALAVLFAASLRRWDQAGASWMFLIGIVLGGIASGLGVAAALMYALFGREDAQLLRADTWAFLAAVPGFLSIGYLFVAYRSAARLQDSPDGGAETQEAN